MPKLTVATLTNRFLKWARSALAPATVEAYQHQLAKVPAKMLKRCAARCRPADLSTWAKSWHEAQALVRVFNWAVQEAELLRRNPFSRCRMPVRGARRRIIDAATITRFMRTGKRSSRLFVLALRETMARPQEIRSASWEHLQSEVPGEPIDVALRAGRALIVQTEYKDCRRRKGDPRPRILLVSRRLGRAILRIRENTDTQTGAIFRNAHGQAWSKNAVRCLMRRLRNKFGIPKDVRGENVTAYTIRHSLATIAAAAGVGDRVLADLLGHVETRTTARYTHLSVQHLRAARRKFAAD